jgi:hypothetical protein
LDIEVPNIALVIRGLIKKGKLSIKAELTTAAAER